MSKSLQQREYERGQQKVAQWLSDYGIRMVNTRERGLQTDDDGWDHFAWTLTVGRGFAQNPNYQGFEFPFKQGVAHQNRPTLVDIMSSLLSDASCTVGRTFEDFCGDLGYDTDSRKSLALYEQIGINNGRLMKLFRTTDLEALLRRYEPLREAAGL